MKKIKILALIAVAAVAMMSCGSLDSKISKYDKACRAGDTDKANKIAAEIATKYKPEDFTEEQVEKMADAELECSKAQASSMGVELPDDF